jgi:subtilisin family serine protease
MKIPPRRIGLALLAFSLAACADVTDPVGPDAAPQLARTAQASVDVIVTLNPDFAPGGVAANRARAADVARGLGGSPFQTYGSTLYGFAATMPEGRLGALDTDPRVASWEFDQVVSIPGPPRPRASAPKWCADNPDHPACIDTGTEEPPAAGSQVTPWGVTRVGDAGDGTGKTAWVIDTGIDMDHPDLNVDAGRSANFVRRGKDTTDDGNGHGTHVAGTIAAVDNSFGVVGVAAGASVVAVRVLDNSGSGFYSDVIAGVDYVGANGSSGDVANMSLGGGPSSALDNAVKAAAAAGIKFALAAGNSSGDANDHSPARANGPNIYTVSAIDSGDDFASFSNYGNPPIDFAAPGVSVLSLWKGGGMNTISGTSMATPHVAGILLLGSVHTDGTANGDPDGNPDPIAHR